jgi:hypothetical protein
MHFSFLTCCIPRSTYPSYFDEPLKYLVNGTNCEAPTNILKYVSFILVYFISVIPQVLLNLAYTLIYWNLWQIYWKSIVNVAFVSGHTAIRRSDFNLH